MPVKIDKKFYKETLEKYNQLNAEINNGEHSKAAILLNIEEKYNHIKANGGIDRKKPENYPELVSLYLLAKDQETFVPDPSLNEMLSTMEDDLTLELPFFVTQLNTLKEAITSEEQIKVEDFKEILGTGKIVYDNEETRKREEAKASQKQKEAEQRQKEEAERAKEREEKRKEEALKEKEAGAKYWDEMEKKGDIPKYDPNKKQEKEEVKQEYSKDDVSVEAIGSYLKIAENIYNGFSNRGTKIGNQTEFPKQLNDNEIGEKLKSNPNPSLSVDNLVDRVAMYKAQKAKLDSMNPFKRFFSVFFSDARKLKNNMKAIENSFVKDGMNANQFKKILNNDNPALFIKNGVNEGVFGYHNDGSKKLFENSSIDKKAVYMEQHPELIERDKDAIESLKENEANIEKDIKVQIAKNSDKQLLEIADEAFTVEDTDKSFYDDKSHEKALEEAGKYNELDELEV